MTDTPKLEIYSDFNCFWCYFDKPGIQKIRKEYDVDIIWRAFPLHPDLPDEGMPIEELFGFNIPLMTEKMQKLEQMAAAHGLPLAERKTISDTRKAQELAKWVETQEYLTEYHQHMARAYFADARDISDIDVLADIIGQCGLSPEDARRIIRTGEYGKAVDDNWELSERLGIMTAPTYILGVSRLAGSHSYKSLKDLMDINRVA